MARAVGGLAAVVVAVLTALSWGAGPSAGQEQPEPTVHLTVTPGTIREGRSVLLTATIQNPPAEIGRTSFVRFLDEWGKGVIADVPLNGTTQARARATPPPEGFSAIAFLDDQGPRFSNDVFVEVIAGYRVQVSFTTVPAQPSPGDDVTVQVTVTSNGPVAPSPEGALGAPSGVVTVRSGAAALGSRPLDGNGRANVPVTLPAGFAPITVGYEGDDLFVESASGALVPVARPAPAGPAANFPGAGPTAALVVTDAIDQADGDDGDPAADPSPDTAEAERVSDSIRGDGTGEASPDETASAAGAGDDQGAGRVERTSFVDGIPIPSSVDWSAPHVTVNLLLALLLMLLAAIPSVLVDGTIQSNYERIVGAHPRLARVMERTESWLTDLPDGLLLAGLAVVAALICSQLDPSIGWNASSAVLVGALALVIAVVVGVHDLGRLPYLNRRSDGRAGGFGLYPFGLVLAVMLVVVSRLAGFEPGFAFGVVGGLALSEFVDDRDDARSLAAAGIGLLAIAVVAWLAWVPVVDQATAADPGTGVLFVDAFLSSLWLMCLQAVAFGFAPVTFLDGDQVRRWSPKVWLAVYGVGMFLLVQCYLHPSAGRWGALDTNSFASAFSVFAVFLVLGVFFWAWFRFRPAPDAGAPVEASDRDTAGSPP